MPFDVAGARKAGFRDDEILKVAAEHLGISPENLNETLKKHTPTEVLEALSTAKLPPPTSMGKAYTEEQPSVSAATRFGKYMENLSRPNYMMAQGVNAALEGQPIGPAMKSGWDLTKPMVFGDVIQSQMEKRAPGYVAENPSRTAAMSTIGGLGLDVALDPTTYLPGAVGTLWKGAKLIPGVEKAAKAGRAMAKEAILGSDIVSDTGRLFSNQVGSREHREAYNILKKYEDLQGYRAGTAVKEMAELDKKIVKLAKETGEDLPTLRGRIIDSVEKRAITDNPTINDVVDSLVTRNAEQLAAERAAGLKTGQVTQETGAVDYFIHALSDDGKKWLEKNGGPGFKGVSRQMTDTHASMIQRKYGDMGVAEVNDMMRQKGMKGDFFLVDPARAQAIRDVRSARAITGAEFYDEMGKTFGVSADAPEGYVRLYRGQPKGKAYPPSSYEGGDAGRWFSTEKSAAEFYGGDIKYVDVPKSVADAAVQPDTMYSKTGRYLDPEWANKAGNIESLKSTDGLVAVKPERLKGQLFPPEVAKVIDAHHEKFTNPEEVNTVFRAYDAAQNWWKAWTLGIFPAYHARNMAGNIWNNSLAGVRNPAVYQKAAEMQMGKAGVLKTALGDMDYQDVVKLAGEKGVLGKGFYGGDIPEAVTDAMAKGKWLTLGRDNKLVKTGRHIGSLIEDNARLAHFVDKLQKGMDADTAAQSVKKFLFDYTELTPTEQNVLKRVFPFYSWSRKNIPLQLEMMVRKPGQQLLPVKLKHEVERLSAGDKPIPDANLPEWLAGDYPIRTSERHTDEKDQSKNVFSYTPVAGYLPWGDLPRMMNNPAETAGFMVSPLLKEPAQQAANYDLYFKRKIANKEIPQAYVFPSEGEEFTRFMGVKLSPRAAHVARNIRLLATMHRANPFQAFGETTSELGTGEKLSQYILGARTYDVDEITAMIQGMYSEKKKIDSLQKDLYVLGRDLAKARAQGKNQAAEDAEAKIKLITDAMSRIGREEFPKHISK